MDLKVNYKLTGSTNSIAKRVRAQVLTRIESLVQTAVDSYIGDLEKHMGGIHGASPYADGKVSWDALEDTQLKEAPRFWVESGKAKQSISVNLKVSDSSVSAFVGISAGAPGYQEALWNELGFTPANGDKLIRRPLFIPLAETHRAELQSKLTTMLAGTRISVRI